MRRIPSAFDDVRKPFDTGLGGKFGLHFRREAILLSRVFPPHQLHLVSPPHRHIRERLVLLFCPAAEREDRPVDAISYRGLCDASGNTITTQPHSMNTTCHPQSDTALPIPLPVRRLQSLDVQGFTPKTKAGHVFVQVQGDNNYLPWETRRYLTPLGLESVNLVSAFESDDLAVLMPFKKTEDDVCVTAGLITIAIEDQRIEPKQQPSDMLMVAI